MHSHPTPSRNHWLFFRFTARRGSTNPSWNAKQICQLGGCYNTFKFSGFFILCISKKLFVFRFRARRGPPNSPWNATILFRLKGAAPRLVRCRFSTVQKNSSCVVLFSFLWFSQDDYCCILSCSLAFLNCLVVFSCCRII